MEIAHGMRGDAGAQLVDQAWRTAGVRDLVTIPLYLTALLSLPEGAPFPTTKEEVLRRFIAAHEQEARRSEEHTSELQSLMRNSYAVFCLKKKIKRTNKHML